MGGISFSLSFAFFFFFFGIGLDFQTVPRSLNDDHQWANKRVKWAWVFQHLSQARD